MPTLPRSEARLHQMLNVVHSPSPSKRLADVLTDLDSWEGQFRECYECGGDAIPDKTKVFIAMTMLPMNTPALIRRALRSIDSYDNYKHEHSRHPFSPQPRVDFVSCSGFHGKPLRKPISQHITEQNPIGCGHDDSDADMSRIAHG